VKKPKPGEAKFPAKSRVSGAGFNLGGCMIVLVVSKSRGKKFGRRCAGISLTTEPVQTGGRGLHSVVLGGRVGCISSFRGEVNRIKKGGKSLGRGCMKRTPS